MRRHLALGTVAKIATSTDINLSLLHAYPKTQDAAITLQRTLRHSVTLWVTWHNLNTNVPDTKRIVSLYPAHDALRFVADAIQDDCLRQGIEPTLRNLQLRKASFHVAASPCAVTIRYMTKHISGH
ncbi:Aste57867_22768 [Aphanomyces stellatus]|uniref:Aste57867_22768 protein n=1 Tax=Aphanomyces stellatus TaxID=120398 RepID=A0A485LMS9_9STRA|nr:hypothetical protein As57867_022698 [Aphanomyces stellatus]VFT99421.1 Aste57867_22768 [Aphanomyces stellatus]